MKIKLSRKQFWALHESVFEKCFGHDFNAVYRNNPNVTKIYGFGPNASYPQSIRQIVDNEGKYENFNTRLLHELRKNYDEGHSEFFMTEYLLIILLAFLGFDNIEHFSYVGTPPDRIKNLANNENAHVYTHEFNARYWDLKNSIWYLYYTDKDSEGTDILFRAILKINNAPFKGNDDLEVHLETPGDKQFSDFKGKVIKRYSNLNTIHIILHADTVLDIPTKFRYLIFRIEPTGKQDKTKELYIGQYLRYTSGYEINSRVIIAHRQPIKYEHSIRAITIKHSFSNVEDWIRQYFQLSTSRLLTPSNIFSPADLNRALLQLKKAHLLEVKHHDLYIAAPVSELLGRAELLDQIYSEIEEMLNSPILAKLGIHNVYHKKKNQLKERTASNKQLTRELEAIKNAKQCLFVYPVAERFISSIDVLLGASIFSGKPTYVLHKGSQYVPRIIRKEVNNLRLIEEEIDIMTFPEWLRDNIIA